MLHSKALARILAIALTAILSAADVRAEPLPPQRYNTSHGLAHDRIRCVLADSRGFLWFCTPDGLSRFDGSQFVTYGLEHGLPHPSVEDFVEVEPGVYWAATVGGLARLRSSAGPSPRVTTVDATVAHTQPTIDGPAPFVTYSLGADVLSNHVFSLKKDRAGRLWIGTAGGLFVLDRPSAEPSFRRIAPDAREDLPPFGQVRALAESADGGLWIGARSGLFRQLPDGPIVREPLMRAVAEVHDLLADRSGRVWIGHAGGMTVFIPSSPSADAIPGRPLERPSTAPPDRYHFRHRLAKPADSIRSWVSEPWFAACRRGRAARSGSGRQTV